MTELKNFKLITQSTNTSCWVACAAMIYNFIYGVNVTEESIAENFSVDLNSMDSAVELLAKMNRIHGCVTADFPSDAYTIPTLEEIGIEIEKKSRPLLCCVGADEPSKFEKEPNEVARRYLAENNYQNGHWVVIIGADSETGELKIADPNPMVEIQTVAYSVVEYCNNIYWKNTTYFNF